MSRKGKCTREYLYTALRMSAAPDPEIKNFTLRQETGNTFKLYTGGRERRPPPSERDTRVPQDTPDLTDRSSPAEKETIKDLQYSFP